ncbi:MAG TPA: acetate/propionate family kinase [Kribbella sp.]|jgi:acetate kinase
MNLLIVNAGSSSLKLRVLDDADEVVDEEDIADWDGDPEPLDSLLGKAAAVVHRVVHGGDRFGGAALVDDQVEAQIEELVPLAPLHQPRALELIRHSRRTDQPVVACFDTSYHRTIPDAAATYALPAEWRRRWNLRKYGFHGLSHQYVAGRAPEVLGRPLPRLVSCHLGAGASLCAVADGRSVDTTMGFTPVDGLVMATRSGSVDPGLLMWLQTEGGLSATQVGAGIEHQAGLLGLSEKSGDLREVLAGLDAGDERCRLAFAVYVYRLAGEIARMAAALGGLDAIAFTGGVGEHSVPLRAAVTARLGWLGVVLDAESNESADGVISPPRAAVGLVVIPSREDVTMAAQARAVLKR